MKRAAIMAFVALLAAPGPVQAASSGPAQVGQYVELQPVGLPIVAKGQLVNYVFVYVRLNLAVGADATRLRDKEPYFRDALVRMAHRTPFTVASDYNRIDEARLAGAMMREGSVIAGPGAIRTVVVSSQAPQHRIATPRN